MVARSCPALKVWLRVWMDPVGKGVTGLLRNGSMTMIQCVNSHWGHSVNSGQVLGDLEQGAQLGCHRHSPGERQQGLELREEDGLEGKGEERDAKEATWMDLVDGTLRKKEREDLGAG